MRPRVAVRVVVAFLHERAPPSRAILRPSLRVHLEHVLLQARHHFTAPDPQAPAPDLLGPANPDPAAVAARRGQELTTREAP
jgi:hypothetical protein